MGIKEFWKKLRACRDQFDWYIKSDGRIRAREKGRFLSTYCPLTAVTKIETGKQYWTGHYPESANQLGLNKAQGDRIALAADNVSQEKFQSTRRQMLRALRLQEKEG